MWTTAVDDVGPGCELEVNSRVGRVDSSRSINVGRLRRGDSSRSIKVGACFFKLGKLSRKLTARSAARVAAVGTVGAYSVGEEGSMTGSAVGCIPDEDGEAGKESSTTNASVSAQTGS